jgi:G:T/U-mismatch repair DNA glycosylase
MISAGIEVKISRLESIVEQIGEAVRLETLSVQGEEQGKQVQQQGYQIFALCDAVQTLAESQDSSLQKLNQLTKTLDQLTSLIQGADD